MLNQKKIQSILLLLILAVPMLISPNYYQVDGEIEEILESNNDLAKIDPISDDIDSSPATKQSVIDPNKFYQGPSILTEIEFNKQSFDFDFVSHLYAEDLINTEYVYPSYDTFTNNYAYLFSDDVLKCELGATIESPPTANDWITELTITVRIKAGGSGTFYYDLNARAIDNTANHYELQTSFLTGSTSVSVSDLDYEGWYYLELHVSYEIDIGNDILRLFLYEETISGKTQLGSLISASTSATITNAAVLMFQLDRFYFLRDTISNNLRTNYKYTSPTTKTLKIEPPSVPHAKEMRIYTDWDFSAITPTATVTDETTYWKIASPTELTYSILFNSESSNHLAIADVSTDYLLDANFEIGLYQNDWDLISGTASTSNVYVFDGYQSLYATHSVVSVSGSEGYYPFDVDATDSGSNGIDGTLENGAYITSGGIKDNCVAFAGDNDYVDVATEVYADGEAEVSVSLWFKTSAIAGTIFEMPTISSIYCWMEADGSLKMHMKNTLGAFFTIDPTLVVNTDTWFHLVLTYKESDYFKVYINGLFIDEVAVTGTLQSTSGLHIGCNRNIAGFLEGYIDEFYIFHHDLTPDEILALYSSYSMSHDFDSTETFYFSYAYYLTDEKIIIETEDETITHETSSERWNVNTFYSNTSYFNVTCNGTFYFDSFKIFKTSISLTTTGYYEYTVSVPFVVADSYQFPASSYTNFSLTSMLDSTDYYLTDENGEKEIILNEMITETEYILSANASSSLRNSTLTFTPETFSETPNLYETDTNFYLSSTGNNYIYSIYSDEKYLGFYTDLQTILKNNTIGSHNLTYVLYSDEQKNAYIPETYEYLYTVDSPAFVISVESFYLSDLYVNTYISSNYNFDYYVFEDNDPVSDGSGNKEGTTISSNRDTTAGVTIAYAIKFVYSSEIIWFNTSYSNSRSAFYVEEYKIDKGEENIQIIWSTTKSDIDSLTVYEGTVLKVDADTTSPSSWAKSTTIGVHYVTLIFEAVTYGSIIYSFNYEIVADVFEVNVESFHLSEVYVTTYITASENGNYQVFENNTAITDPAAFYYAGTSIQTSRNVTEGAFLNYAIKFYNAAEDTIWFNTTYSNTLGDFFVNDYSVNLGETTITITWATSLPDSDYITVKEDGVTKVASDETSPTDWAKSTVVGTHVVTLLFQAAGYTTITYSFNYPVYAVADFQVDVGSFQVSDDYVNTYVSSNYDGNYYVYEDNVQIDTSILSGAGTVVETSRDTTEGVTIAYAIKFVYEAIDVWFNTTYSNPVTPFHLTDYRVTDGATIIITWDSTLPALDSLTIYEDGDLKVNADPESTTSWTKSTTVGNHYVTLIFSATDYTDIIHSFSYTVYPPIAFSVFVEIFYVSDDYLNMYLTSNYDYSYTVYENSTEIGTGNGMAIGTTIISPKNREAGLYNFTVIFSYNSETIPFMTWYSNLIPPLHPLNDLYREQSQGFYNISVYSNLEFYWIDVYHDHDLIIDDSTASFFSIEKGLRVGWHNITLLYIYNCSTNAEGYPVAEYNVTIAYEFNYETTFFYNAWIRYIEDDIGLAISKINVNDFKTYIDGELIEHGDINDVETYSNYSYISNYDIRIKNTAPSHNLVVKDLLDTTILSTTLDISSFTYKIITLPIYRLGVINWDNETHRFGVQTLANIDKPWHLSPEIPQGVFIEFWFCDVIYLFRIYSATTYYDEDGYPYKLWDKWEDLPPGRLPRIFEIPLTYDGEEVPEPPGWWTTPGFIGGMSLASFIIIIIAVLVIYRLIKKKGVFKK